MDAPRGRLEHDPQAPPLIHNLRRRFWNLHCQAVLVPHGRVLHLRPLYLDFLRTIYTQTILGCLTHQPLADLPAPQRAACSRRPPRLHRRCPLRRAYLRRRHPHHRQRCTSRPSAPPTSLPRGGGTLPTTPATRPPRPRATLPPPPSPPGTAYPRSGPRAARRRQVT